MAKLTDYLDAKTLGQLQDAFTAVAQVPIRICDSQGAPLTPASSAVLPAPASELTSPGQVEQAPTAGGELKATVVIEGQEVGQITVEGQADQAVSNRASWLLRLMAGMVGRLYDREMQLRTRAAELATLYRLTGEFTGPKDLQSILNTVAKTVVDAMKAKGCSIRLLSEDHRELLIKAVHNLSPEYLNKGPILLSESKIDNEVVATGKLIYIADERSDPRVLYPTEARQEGIVSALVAPMAYRGRVEGIIRVYMAQKYEFDWFEVSLLEAIAAQAAAALVNARLYAEAIQATAIKRQLRMAADVQRQMIPSEPPKAPGLQIAAAYVPCFELGGDFYDFLELPPDNLGLAICDVAGKGVRASLLMASIRASLRAHAANIYDMSEVLTRVNRDLCEDLLVSDFATLFYGVFDNRNRRFTYANAGHPPPLLLRGKTISRLSTGGGLLGVDAQAAWKHDHLTLQKGDIVLAYTDGLTEGMNFADESFGVERVEKALLAAAGSDHVEGIVRHILWEMRRFTGLQTRGDDLTMVAIKVL